MGGPRGLTEPSGVDTSSGFLHADPQLTATTKDARPPRAVDEQLLDPPDTRDQTDDAISLPELTHVLSHARVRVTRRSP